VKGLLLVGGFRIRLRPFTFTRNKHTLQIASKPIVLNGLENIIRSGIKNVGVVLGQLKEGIIETIGKRYEGSTITYINQPKFLGLAHTIMVSRDFLGNEPFVMHLGDNLLKDRVSEMIRKFNETNADAVIGVKGVKDLRQ